jgi:hypothetical protein
MKTYAWCPALALHGCGMVAGTPASIVQCYLIRLLRAKKPVSCVCPDVFVNTN